MEPKQNHQLLGQPHEFGLRRVGRGRVTALLVSQTRVGAAEIAAANHAIVAAFCNLTIAQTMARALLTACARSIGAGIAISATIAHVILPP